MSVMRQMPTLGKSFSMKFPPKSYLGPGKHLVMWAEGEGLHQGPTSFHPRAACESLTRGPGAEEAPNPLRFRV